MLEPNLSPQIGHQNVFPDSRFNASYYLDEANSTGRPEHAILNNKEGSWCPLHNRGNEWLELDLGSDQTIYGVAVQGSHDLANKVTTYTISLRAHSAPEGSWNFKNVSIPALFCLCILRGVFNLPFVVTSWIIYFCMFCFVTLCRFVVLCYTGDRIITTATITASHTFYFQRMILIQKTVYLNFSGKMRL